MNFISRLDHGPEFRFAVLLHTDFSAECKSRQTRDRSQLDNCRQDRFTGKMAGKGREIVGELEYSDNLPAVARLQRLRRPAFAAIGNEAGEGNGWLFHWVFVAGDGSVLR